MDDDGGVLYLVVSGAPAPEGIPALVAACTGPPMVPRAGREVLEDMLATAPRYCGSRELQI